jgi:hypothetical protein
MAHLPFGLLGNFDIDADEKREKSCSIKPVRE